MKITILLAAAFAFLSCPVSAEQAAPPGNWFLYGHGGPAYPHHSHSKTLAAFGGGFGRRIFKQIDAGLRILGSSQKDDISGIERSDGFFLLNADYHCPKFWGLYAGGRFGFVNRSLTVPGLGTHDEAVAGYGVGLGYEHPLADWLFIGLAYDWLYAPKATSSKSSAGVVTNVEFAPIGYSHILAVVKMRV